MNTGPRAWLLAMLLTLAGCQSTPTHLLTYSAQGVVIQAERLVAPFFDRAADPLPYGGPDIDQPLRRMHERFARLKTQLDNGALDLTDEGEVAIREVAATTAELELLTCAENLDRAILYRAMSTAAGYSDGVYIPYVEASFSTEWQNRRLLAGGCVTTGGNGGKSLTLSCRLKGQERLLTANCGCWWSVVQIKEAGSGICAADDEL